MKYTMEGFSQAFALKLRRVETDSTGKEHIVKIDITDLAILRWFTDFYPKMKKKIIGDKEYAWVTYNKLLEDIPLLDIDKRGLYKRMSKLVSFKILERLCVKDKGTFLYVTFGENYLPLISSEDYKEDPNNGTDPAEGVGTKVPTGRNKSSDGVGTKVPNKDSSITDKSIKDSSIKDKNKEELRFYPNDEILNDTFKDYIEMRKKIKAPMTDKAIELAINTLNKLSAGDNEKAIQILNQSIFNGWRGLFPLKEERTSTTGNNKPQHRSFADIARERGLL